jgi:hypothetical protein
MNDTTNTQDPALENQDTAQAGAEDLKVSVAEELDALKARADLLGISYSPRIGADKLREKIKLAMSDEGEKDDEPEEKAPLSRAQLRQKIRKESMKMVRVRIANMNPAKADLRGEFFTVASKYLGVVKRFVPFGEETDDGWHIPKIIYDEIKARKFLHVKSRKDRKNNNNLIVSQRWVPEFSIEVLPPLTKSELDKLAAQQAAAKGL